MVFIPAKERLFLRHYVWSKIRWQRTSYEQETNNIGKQKKMLYKVKGLFENKKKIMDKRGREWKPDEHFQAKQSPGFKETKRCCTLTEITLFKPKIAEQLETREWREIPSKFWSWFLFQAITVAGCTGSLELSETAVGMLFSYCKSVSLTVVFTDAEWRLEGPLTRRVGSFQHYLFSFLLDKSVSMNAQREEYAICPWKKSVLSSTGGKFFLPVYR